ncbi:uncharacterized protein LOC111621494 [Centruroides sculpturatus]|uniref:uncharacterized protein LOC111621494 n=1 Tax=Centruroides sculpturatus TaxID=218467 RepID=UPI000C6EE85F|nr:uncharacterized protein LOC111621494 [Centruroides sculpturatus]
MVCSKLDYGCIVYGSARESTLRMLDAIHHQVLRLCTGAYRTSPVQISDTQRKRLFEARPSGVPTFVIRMENVSNTIDLDTSNILEAEVNSIPPWSTPVINVDFCLKQFPKEFTLHYVYRQQFSEIQHNDRNLIPIYTDGCKSDDYVISAFVCQDEIVAEQISPNSSISTAELHAIHLALKYVIRKGHRHCMIYTDSQVISLQLHQLVHSLLYQCDLRPNRILQRQLVLHSIQCILKEAT